MAVLFKYLQGLPFYVLVLHTAWCDIPVIEKWTYMSLSLNLGNTKIHEWYVMLFPILVYKR